MREHLLPPSVRDNVTSVPLWVPLQHRRGEIQANPKSQQLRGQLIEDLKRFCFGSIPGATGDSCAVRSDRNGVVPLASYRGWRCFF